MRRNGRDAPEAAIPLDNASLNFSGGQSGSSKCAMLKKCASIPEPVSAQSSINGPAQIEAAGRRARVEQWRLQ
jgi:hypothetical protein